MVSGLFTPTQMHACLTKPSHGTEYSTSAMSFLACDQIGYAGESNCIALCIFGRQTDKTQYVSKSSLRLGRSATNHWTIASSIQVSWSKQE
jgi:hypothetical protein